MKTLRNLLLVAVITVFSALSAYAIEYTRSTPVNLGVAAVTETLVAISSTANTTVLAANANRMDFDIQLASCTSPGVTSTIVYYAYDGSLTVGSSTSTVAFQIDQQDASGWQGQFFKKPQYIMPTGAIVAQASAAGCVAIVQEWVTTSPVWQ